MTDWVAGGVVAVRPVHATRTARSRLWVLVPVEGEVSFDQVHSGEFTAAGVELPWLRCGCGRSRDWLLWTQPVGAGATCRCGRRTRDERLTRAAVEALAVDVVASWPSLEAAEAGLGFDGSRLAS